MTHWPSDIIGVFKNIGFAPFLVGILGALGSFIVSQFSKGAWRKSRWLQPIAYLFDAVAFYFLRYFRHRVAYRASIRQYATNRLNNEAINSMSIPVRGAGSLSLDKAYVPLHLLRGNEKRDAEVLLSGDFKRMIVIGDPGSGKSTLSKSLIRQMCWKVLSSREIQLPVLFELKNLPDTASVDPEKAGDWIYEQIAGVVGGVGAFDSENVFDQCAKADPGVYLVLDGLDEVNSKSYPIVSAAINELSIKLADMNSNSIVLLTMREQYYSLVSADFSEFTSNVFSLAPFAPTDIWQFLSSYPFGERSDREAARIYSDLTDRPTLREMCGNPLILSMYVATDNQDVDSLTPDTRSSFYDLVCSELIVKRRSRQLRTMARTNLMERRQSVLGLMAYANLMDSESVANSFSLESALAAVRSRGEADSNEEAADYIDELIQHTGLLSYERSGESLRFMHLSFTEFLAAKYCVHDLGDEGWMDLSSQYGSEVRASSLGAARLVEVIPFAVALMIPAKRSKAAADLLALEAGPRVLGRVIYEADLLNDSICAKYIATEYAFLTQAEIVNWDNEWRERLHLFSMVLSEQRQRYPGIATLNKDDVYLTLVQGDEKRASRLFSSFAEYDAAALFRLAENMGVELAEDAPEVFIRSASSEIFLDIVYARIASGAANASLLSSLLALSAMSGNAGRVLYGYKSLGELDDRLNSSHWLGKWTNVDKLEQVTKFSVSNALRRNFDFSARRTFESQCFEFLCEEFDSLPQELKRAFDSRVRLLRSLKKTGNIFAFSSLGPFIPYSVGCAAFALCVVLLKQGGFRNHDRHEALLMLVQLLGFVLSFVVIVASLSFSTCHKLRHRFYRWTFHGSMDRLFKIDASLDDMSPPHNASAGTLTINDLNVESTSTPGIITRFWMRLFAPVVYEVVINPKSHKDLFIESITFNTKPTLYVDLVRAQK